MKKLIASVALSFAFLSFAEIRHWSLPDWNESVSSNLSYKVELETRISDEVKELKSRLLPADGVVRYSKLKLGDQLEAAGIYSRAEAWMLTNGVFRQWRDAQYFESNYHALIAATNLAVSSGLVTNEQMINMLNASEDK